MTQEWVTKDSGERAQYDSGMVRDTEEGKARFDLLLPKDIPYDQQMLTRFADLLARGAEKYTERNWEKAGSEEELARYYSSAFRHFMQWITGETDEDHAAAVFFNIQCAEYVKYKLANQERENNPIVYVKPQQGGQVLMNKNQQAIIDIKYDGLDPGEVANRIVKNLGRKR